MLVPTIPKTYLQTTFKDREQVKSLGSRWDPDRRQWFVPEGRDLTSFGSWLPAEHQTALSTQESEASSELALPTKGVSLSQLVAGVAQAVARAYGAGEWVRAEVVKGDARNGHVCLELAERSLAGDSLAQARAIIWANTANQILPAFERATGVVLGTGLKLLLLHAKPTLSPQYGLSPVVDAIDPDHTLGDLEAKKREIRARLQREGLTELNRSLPAPWDGFVAQSRLPGLVASWHDRTQGRQDTLQDHQLGDVQRRAQSSRVVDDLAGQRHAVVRAGQWQARTPADLL
jgi:exodeoxyribonuclease VII large subunit